MKTQSKYITSALVLVITSVIVKVIGAVYKIPLTAFIGGVGRGYFAAAYNIYIPVHAILLGSLPIALSRLVSKYNAADNRLMLSSLRKGSGVLFFVFGLAGTLLILLCAKPYSVFIANSPKSVYTILVLAPSILFSCLSARYRGYFEGYMNMQPTSVSQTVEALFKLVFGLAFARLSMALLYNSFVETHTVLGNYVANEAQALSVIYPYTSACAMLGVTLGSAVSWLYTYIYYLINRERNMPKGNALNGSKQLLSFSFPIMLSCVVQSVFQFLDTASVQFALGKTESSILYNAYSQSITAAGVYKEDYVTYVYGLFSTALDFKNLVPGITMALGVCAVPAICREFESNNHSTLNTLVNSIYKYTALLSVFGGAFIALCSKDILNFFYGSSAEDIVIGCEDLVKYFGLTVPLYSLASTAVFCVQAVGKPEKSVLPYAASGIIRVALNLVLISNSHLLLKGTVISGAAGYFVMLILNLLAEKRVSKTKFDIKNVIIKPVLIGSGTYFLCKTISFFVNFSKNLFFNLLIEFFLFSFIFCILCLLLKMLSFNEIFSIVKSKKNGLNT